MVQRENRQRSKFIPLQWKTSPQPHDEPNFGSPPPHNKKKEQMEMMDFLLLEKWEPM
jgi:hypothetical protein